MKKTNFHTVVRMSTGMDPAEVPYLDEHVSIEEGIRRVIINELYLTLGEDTAPSEYDYVFVSTKHR